MQELISKILKFRDARDWKQFHTPENIAKSISIEANEILEHFQWDNQFDSKEVGDELADVFMYLVLMADSIDVDLKEVVLAKLKTNESRYSIEKSKGNSRKQAKPTEADT